MRSQVLTTHLTDWDRPHAAQAAEDVTNLTEHPGWATLLEAIELRERSVREELLNREPTDNAAAYATTVGTLRGLREVSAVAEGVIKHGRKAEQAMRISESAEQAA